MKLSLISAVSMVGVVVGLTASMTAANAAVTFMTFLSSGDLAAVGPWWTINAFGYTGSGFVGSIRTNGLYSTNLTGGNIRLYGEPIPGLSGGEVSVGVGLGRAGFGKGAVYVDDPKDGRIYRVPSVGAPVLFGTTPQNPSKIFFDPGSTFGGDMLVMTAFGKLYKFTSSGTSTLLANVGEDTEGMDIAGSAFGPYAGDLLVASEISGAIRAISPEGVITRLRTSASHFVSILGAETVNVVPASLGSGNPVEGFYVVNSPRDILKAAASEFLSLKGDAIVTSEAAGSPIWDLKYDSRTGFFDTSQVGALPNHPEDSIFVTDPELVNSELTVPEPSIWAMMLLGFTGLGFAGYRASRKGAAADLALARPTL